jgi:hypothetical protein
LSFVGDFISRKHLRTRMTPPATAASSSIRQPVELLERSQSYSSIDARRTYWV